MREILFRGKTDNKWVYGVPIYLRKEAYIVRDFCLGGDYTDDWVEAETVGQFTGLTDKNGKKIFEGDILRLCNGTYPIKVFYDCLGWKFSRNGKPIKGAFECDIKHDIELCEVIGNIYDNPELLEVEK